MPNEHNENINRKSVQRTTNVYNDVYRGWIVKETKISLYYLLARAHKTGGSKLCY